MRVLAILSGVVILTWACGSADTTESVITTEKSVEALFKTHCSICHGNDGRKGLAGARILPESTLTLEERVQLITRGKGNMMSYQGLLSAEQIEALAEYTTTFK